MFKGKSINAKMIITKWRLAFMSSDIQSYGNTIAMFILLLIHIYPLEMSTTWNFDNLKLVKMLHAYSYYYIPYNL